MLKAVTRRLRGAAYYWAAVAGADPPTKAELARRVSEVVGRPYTQQAASGWWNGAEPPPDVIRAVAGLFGVSAGWLQFGEGAPPWATPSAAAAGPPLGPAADPAALVEAARLVSEAELRHPATSRQRRRR